MIAVLIICGIGVMGNGNGHKSGKGAGDYKKETVESGVKKVDAAAKGPGPFSTLSPYEEKYIDIRQNGLCYYKTTAVNIWDDPEKMGFEYDDPVYQLIAFEQEFDEKGNAKYTDIVVPEEIDDIPVINSLSFAGHYEIKSLRIKARYSCENIIYSRGYVREGSLMGCTNLEHYEIPLTITSLDYDTFKGCNALTTLNIPKNVENIDENAFRGCNHLKTITFDKFSNLYNADGLRKLSWWKEHTQENGMTIYEKCLLDAGKKGGTITLRGNKVEKILFGAFRKSKAKIIRLENVKEMSVGALLNSNAQKVILGKGTKTIPSQCFYGNKKLKEIRITSKEKVIWGKSSNSKDNHYMTVGLEKEALNQKVDIYIYSEKLDQKSLHKANFSAKKVTLHVPAKMVSKYRDCVECKVVALKK